MLTLMVLGSLLLYLLASIAVVISAVSWADKSGYRPGITGLIAALVMYNLVFWDLIPVYAVHSYQCKVNAGFTVYKSLDEWKKENPHVAETLTPNENAKWQHDGNITRVPLNQRIVWQTTREKVWHIVQGKDEKIIDTETNEVLAQNIDYYTTQPSMARGGDDLSDLKFWLDVNSCTDKKDKSKWLVDGDSFYTLYLKYKHINGDQG